MAVIAYYAILVEVHDDGRTQVRTEDAHLERVAGRTTKVLDGCTAGPMGPPRDAADQVIVAVRALAGQLAAGLVGHPPSAPSRGPRLVPAQEEQA